MWMRLKTRKQKMLIAERWLWVSLRHRQLYFRPSNALYQGRINAKWRPGLKNIWSPLSQKESEFPENLVTTKKPLCRRPLYARPWVAIQSLYPTSTSVSYTLGILLIWKGARFIPSHLKCITLNKILISYLWRLFSLLVNRSKRLCLIFVVQGNTIGVSKLHRWGEFGKYWRSASMLGSRYVAVI